MDLVIENARVFGHPNATTVVIDGGKIAAVGKQAAKNVRQTLDAKGAWVIPGFVDAHAHLLKGGLSLTRPKLNGLKSVEEVTTTVAAWAAAHPDVDWILGRGWDYDIVPRGESPTRQSLDAVVLKRPVCLDAYDGHSTWCNSAGLRAAGIDATTPDPDGGKIVREADGKTPAGTLLETARLLARKHYPSPSREAKKNAIAAALLHARSLGVTTVADISYESDRGLLLAELEREGRLPLRVVVGLPLDDNLGEAVRDAPKWESERLRLGFAKIFVDGIFEAKTAFVVEPYPKSDDHGRPLLSRERLVAKVKQAHALGVPVAFHAIGDAAVRLALDAVEAAGPAPVPLRGPDRIEHIELLHHHDAARFAALGVVASMQPYHAVPSDAAVPSGAWAENVGEARLPMTFAWRTLDAAGAPMAFGSDWPVLSMDPLWGIAVATTTKNRRQLPPAGRNPGQTLDATKALTAATKGAARALGLQDVGVIEEGAAADLLVLSPRVDFENAQTLWDDPRFAHVVVQGAVVSEAAR